jgi:hypothetical protein
MGNYTDGGSDMARINNATYAHQGSYSARIRDNSGTASSFWITYCQDVTGYSDLEVEFWFVAVSMDNSNEDFWVQFYNGSGWQTVATFAQGIDFQNNVFYNVVVPIPASQYAYTTCASIRFVCDASGNSDWVYIDEIEFRGFGGGRSPATGLAVAAAPSLEIDTDDDASVSALPTEVSLSRPVPNPFRGATTLSYALPEESRVVLEVFNVAGARVSTLVDGTKPAGVHAARIDGGTLGAGIYFARLQAGDRSVIRKVMLLK